MRNVALLYIRRSVVKNAVDQVSPERQRAHCLAEAERRGWIAELFSDAEGHRSGRRERGRPGWLSLKEQLDRPDVAAVIVESLARASRSVKDLAKLVEELNARGIALVSVREAVDTNSAMGRAFIGFIGVMAEFESDIASERMSANIAYKREHKGRHWGLTPFGCAREGPNRVLVPSEEGATVDGVWHSYHEALRKCYEWYAAGELSLVHLSDRLNGAGYRFRDRHGKPRYFNEWDVRRLLDAHRLYAGYVLLGRSKDRPEEEFKGSHDPILQLELCDRVAVMLKVRHDYGEDFHGQHGPGRTYLLSDLLYCAACGHRMAGYYQDGRERYRHERAKRECPAKGQAVAADLEAQVMEQLRQFEMPDQLKERICFLARKLIEQDGQPAWQEARATLRHLTRKLENLKEMRVEGEIDKAEYQRRKQEIEATIHQAQERLRHAPTDVKDLEGLLPKVDQIAEVIHGGSPEHKKELFNSLFERIEQRDGQLIRLIPRAWAKSFFSGSNGKENQSCIE